MTRNLIYISVFLMIASCKKEDTTALEGTFEASTTVSVSRPVMYVKNMVIHDTAIINTFLRLHNHMSHFTYAETETFPTSSISIRIGPGNTASLKFSTYPDFMPGFRALYAPGEMVLEKTDTIRIEMVPYIPDVCDVVKALKSYGYRSFHPYPWNPNEGYILSLPQIPFLYADGILRTTYPTISTATHSNLAHCFQVAKISHVISEPHIEAYIGDNDTAVVQNKYAVMNRVQ